MNILNPGQARLVERRDDLRLNHFHVLVDEMMLRAQIGGRHDLDDSHLGGNDVQVVGAMVVTMVMTVITPEMNMTMKTMI